MKSRMNLSSGHGYAHPKSKQKFVGKPWVEIKKFPKTVHQVEKKANLNSSTTPDTHTNTHTNKTNKTKNKKGLAGTFNQ